MLMAAGYSPYAHLNVHGYWNMGKSKMSKSLGNVIRPLEMRDRFGLDGFRYFLLREMVFGMDSAFTEDLFVTRFNADLSNGLGNLVSRVLSMQQKYFGGKVQAFASGPRPEDEALAAAFHSAEKDAKAQVEQLAFHTALEKIWVAIAACDKYVVETSPFKMWKDESARPRVGEILHVLCDALRHSARLIAPFMPETAARIATMLRTEPSQIGQLGEPAPAWFKTFRTGHEVAAPEPLFPRIEVEKS
jgi:methionyl-tRNA synthetase